MTTPVTFLIARQLWRNAFKSASLYVLLLVMYTIMAYAAYSGWKSYTVTNSIRAHYQHEARTSWESNPDKHPHRMAHYGSFAFRLKHPLSMFDFGIESYAGNAVYLEAHKQNTVNFSEAGFSNGLLRLGEISMAMLLQIIIPLVIFFLGFTAVAAEREIGTLKIILTQGATWKNILLGKSLGLMALVMPFFIPAVVITGCLIAVDNSTANDTLSRFTALILAYLLFYFIVCVITILTSAVSRSSKDALIRLLGIWLFFVILLPRTTQALGNYFYPAPSKIAFESAIEADVIKQGDSHNPDDAHYKAIKDSLLLAHRVDSVHKLPFNYSGFIMREGERLSAGAYAQHLSLLLNTYEDQNRLNRITAFVNPYTAV
jgi:ABC-2 type transport system permease protein